MGAAFKADNKFRDNMVPMLVVPRSIIVVWEE